MRKLKRKIGVVCLSIIAVALLIALVPFGTFAGDDTLTTSQLTEDDLMNVDLLSEAELISEESDMIDGVEVWSYQYGDQSIQISMSPQDQKDIQKKTGNLHADAELSEFTAELERLQAVLEGVITDMETSEPVEEAMTAPAEEAVEEIAPQAEESEVSVEETEEIEGEGTEVVTYPDTSHEVTEDVTVYQDALDDLLELKEEVSSKGAEYVDNYHMSAAKGTADAGADAGADAASEAVASLRDEIAKAQLVQTHEGLMLMSELNAKTSFTSSEGLISKVYGGETLRSYRFYLNGREAYCYDPSIQNGPDNIYEINPNGTTGDGVMAAIMNYGVGGKECSNTSDDAYLDTWVAIIHRKGELYGSANVNAKMERCFQSNEGSYARSLYTKACQNPLTDFTINLYNPNKGSTLEYQRMVQLEVGGFVEIVKVDANTGAKLPGAVFTIDGVSGKYKTDANGITHIRGLAAGTYTVREVSAPDNYMNNSTPQQVTTIGKKATVTFKNTKYGMLHIHKVNAHDGQPLAGATFKIEGIGQLTTDPEGNSIIGHVPPGTYTITEIKAPDGFILNSDPIKVTVKSGETAKVVVENQKLGGIELLKVDAHTEKALSGAVFKIDGLGEFTSDKNGKITIENVMPGTYTVTEIKEPTGYILNSEPQEVVVKANQTGKVTFANEKLGNIEVVKEDAHNGKTLAGAIFNIEGFGEFTSDENGKVTINDVMPGTYKVTEIREPNGYILNSTPQNVVVKANETGKVTFKNEKLGRIEIMKVDAESGEALAGAVFKIEGLGEYTSDKNGKVTLENIMPGTYKVTEIKSPTGFLLNDTPQNVVVKANETGKVTFKNEHQKIDLELYKLADQFTSFYKQETEWGDKATILREEKPLPGVEFTVYHAEDNKKAGAKKDDVAAVVVTGEDGKAVAEQLYLGKYYVMETNVPDGYQVSIERHDVDLSDPDKMTSLGNIVSNQLVNDPQKIALSLEKEQERLVSVEQDKFGLIINTEFDPCTGAVFGLFTAEDMDYELVDAPIVEEDVEGAEGDEVTGEEAEPVALDLEGEGVTEEEVPSEGEEEAPGAAMPAGTLVSILTVEDGQAVTEEDLPFGKYYALELQTPGEEYALDETMYEIEVLPEGNDAHRTIQITTEPIKNYLIRSEFELTKSDVSTGELLPDTGVVIYDANKEPIYEGRTDENGVIYLPELTYGKYYYQEFDAPDGYQLDESLFEFEVLENGDIIKCQMTDRALEPGEEVIVSSYTPTYNPGTGLGTGIGIIGFGLFGAGSTAAFISMKKKKEIDSDIED